jgi:putative ribosome biogenesis GTPase RsgA
MCAFAVGDRVEKTGGDYTFRGYVVAVFVKRSGAVRLVVENADGLLFIFSEAQLRFWKET